MQNAQKIVEHGQLIILVKHVPRCTVYRRFSTQSSLNNPLQKALKALLIYLIMDGLNPDHVAEVYVWCQKQKRKKQREDAAQKGSFTDFHVGFQRCESLTGRKVEQSSPFSTSSPRNSDIVMNTTN